MSYSTTLNIFVPAEQTKRLKHIRIPGKPTFDWRKPGLCHCTVKSLAISKDLPAELKTWETICGEILSVQPPFSVSIEEFTAFPGVAIAKLQSPELIALYKKLSTALPNGQPQHEDYIPHISLAITGESPSRLLDPDLREYSFVASEIQLVVWNLSDLSTPDIRKRYHLSGTVC